MRKRHLLLVINTLVIVLCHCLTSHADSGDFAMDTISPNVQILSPDGGEHFFAGEFCEIIYEAGDPNLAAEPVSIWLFPDPESSFIPIQENLMNSGSFSWQIPPLNTSSARLRILVTDTFGNTTEAISPGEFSIITLIPANPENLVIDSSNAPDVLLNWDPVVSSSAPYYVPMEPDGYIILASEVPHQDADLYTVLGISSLNTYTHAGALLAAPRMFYMVKAFKSYSGDIAHAQDRITTSEAPGSLLWEKVLNLPKGDSE